MSIAVPGGAPGDDVRAVELLDRLLKEKRPVYRAYRQLDFLIPLVWQCTFIEPAKSIFDLVGELEAGEKSHNQGIVSVTHTPGFPPADIAISQSGYSRPECGTDSRTGRSPRGSWMMGGGSLLTALRLNSVPD